MRFSTALIGLAVGVFLAGCSALDALHTAEVYDDLQQADVLSGPAATPDAVALRSGTGTYVGLGVVAASDGSTATAYLGDATILVDFSTATVSGSIDMYLAEGNLDPATDPEAFFDDVQADPAGYLLAMGESSGTVTLSDGSILDATFTATATSNDLIYGSTTVALTGGSVTAEFTGADAHGVRSTDSAVTGTVNGAAATQIELYFAAAE